MAVAAQYVPAQFRRESLKWPNMGYFSDSRRNWAGAFWAATAIPLVLDQSNPIWDESG